jgi:hypothetical protein
MAKVQEKIRAVEMRRQGCSIKDIACELDVSKGSVSLWCQDIILSADQKRNLKEKQIQAGAHGRNIGAQVNKQKRLDIIEQYRNEGEQQINSLSKKELLLLGVGLYWGEGVKSRSGMATIVNSDPGVIQIAKVWFETCFNVEGSDFRPYVYISAHHHARKDVIVQFWSLKLNIPIEFFKIVLLKNRPKKVYENHDDYYGVLHLRVQKSTDLKYRIMGLINACRVVD